MRLINFNKLNLTKIETVHLDTVRLPTATHSDRCLDAFHCSSAVIGLWSNRCVFKQRLFYQIKNWEWESVSLFPVSLIDQLFH